MKALNSIILSVLFATVAMVSCKKEKPLNLTTPPPGLGGDPVDIVNNPIDKWIYDSLTVPYNISVKYKFEPWEVAIDRTLIPPDTSKIIPQLSAINNICWQPYTDQTGSKTFVAKYSPKNFVLVGSWQYDYNGTITLGQAEGGSKISLFGLNFFSRLKKDSAIVKQGVHTIHHEFAHILHQNVMYPADYKSITGGYTATWFNTTDAAARKLGFITAYSMAGPDEDFVEMIAVLLTEGPGGYATMLKDAGAATSVGYLAIKAKEAKVVNYFKTIWGIDFYALQTKTRAAFVGFLQ
ncbi:substrate import-associated zinc metallohydrolase lipoprotein [Filimonas lacunae]|uniref:Substrate import-associated zinc metallohydrolase lipoprotein n=1 Tax=Filimonas lacunae TaxID=477680 RepID=A0A173MK75_9BACT|nr:putative zinc-binding metallopeptidase [Filimonas lacunae]BAV07876.1 hypothetical protein FLA_3907 [Filimonas lacunae]SIT05904.1 substrate import-associated zinc metallohydrolase lipoprotein [Filimonas lacunae]